MKVPPWPGARFSSKEKTIASRVQEVGYPSQKALSPCFASAPNTVYAPCLNSPAYGRGAKGMALRFVDGHREFARCERLNPPEIVGGRKRYNSSAGH